MSAKSDGNTATIKNGLLSLIIGSISNGDLAITSLKHAGKEVLAPNQGGNGLRFYNDSKGNSFQFAYETQGGSSFDLENGKVIGKPTLKVLENGPLRACVETTVTFEVNNQQITYTRTYTVVAGEPYVRIRTTGKAPDNYSVFVQFPLLADSEGYQQMAYGTPNHWTIEKNKPNWDAYSGWTGPFFKGTWNFAMGTKQKSPSTSAPFTIREFLVGDFR